MLVLSLIFGPVSALLPPHGLAVGSSGPTFRLSSFSAPKELRWGHVRKVSLKGNTLHQTFTDSTSWPGQGVRLPGQNFTHRITDVGVDSPQERERLRTALTCFAGATYTEQPQ